MRRETSTSKKPPARRGAQVVRMLARKVSHYPSAKLPPFYNHPYDCHARSPKGGQRSLGPDATNF